MIIPWNKNKLDKFPYRFFVPFYGSALASPQRRRIREQMHRWCEENCSSDIMLGNSGYAFLFKDKVDATAFKLSWE